MKKIYENYAGFTREVNKVLHDVKQLLGQEGVDLVVKLTNCSDLTTIQAASYVKLYAGKGCTIDHIRERINFVIAAGD